MAVSYWKANKSLKKTSNISTRMPNYQALLKQYDPQGKFRNQFIDSSIFSS
jgi:hypothetical protein